MNFMLYYSHKVPILNENKKVKREQKILKVTKELLSIKTFDSISMNEIADLCDIAVGTLYNYFKSKNELWATIFKEYIDEILLEADFVIKEQDTNPLEWIIMVGREHLKICNFSNKNTLRELSQAIHENRKEDSIKNVLYYANNSIQNQIITLINIMRNKQYIRDDITTENIGRLIYNIYSVHFREFLYKENTYESVVYNYSNDLEICFHGISKTNVKHKL